MREKGIENTSIAIAIIVIVAFVGVGYLLLAKKEVIIEEQLQTKIPANYAYFLLPDTYVITDTGRVNEVLSEVYHSTGGKTWAMINNCEYLAGSDVMELGQIRGVTPDSASTDLSDTEEFEEFDEMFIYIDASGDARCKFTAQVPPSKLADFLKFLTPRIGTDKMKQTYKESVRSSLARYGLEVRKPSCDINTEDNFKITMEWEIPGISQWRDNRWTITLEWVDNQSAAEETIAEEEESWVLTRNIAKMYDVQSARYRISSRTALILPENAKNVYCSQLGFSLATDHGGGTYSKSLLYSEQINERHAIVENELMVIATENEITITPQQLIENSLFYTINYSGVSPENVSFISSIKQVRLDLKYGKELRERYSVYSAGSWYSLTPAQILYYAADAIDKYSQDGQFSIQQLISVVTPENENGDLGVCWKNLSKEEYVSLAQTIRDNISLIGKAPGAIDTSLGRIRFRDALYTFTKVLSYYGESDELPSTLIFAPVPTGELTWEYSTAKISADFAEKLCNWTATNITYGLSFSPPTTEEVLESGQGQCRDYANVYLALNRTVGIPARRVSGWVVSTWQPPAGWEFVVGTTPEGKPIGGHTWTQVYLPEEGWTLVDPTANRFENLGYEIYKQMEQTWMDALAGYETGYEII